MNRDTIIGLLLLFALIIGYSWYMSPSEEERIANQKRQDSLRLEQLIQAQNDSISIVNQQTVAEKEIEIESSVTIAISNVDISDSLLKYKQLTELYGTFANASFENDDLPITVENDFYRFKIGRKGGSIKSVEMKNNVLTYDSLPVVLFKEGDNNNSFGFSFHTNNHLILNTNNFYFTPAENYDEHQLSVSGNDSLKISMRLYPDKSHEEIDSSSYIEFLYTIRGDDYRTGFKINFVNISQHISHNQPPLELTWQAQLLQQEQSYKNEMTATTIFYSDINDVENLKEAPDKGDSTSYPTNLKWVSFKQLFFTSTIIADDYFSSGTMTVDVPQIQSDRELKNIEIKAQSLNRLAKAVE